jgi:hypothetical protein
MGRTLPPRKRQAAISIGKRYETRLKDPYFTGSVSRVIVEKVSVKRGMALCRINPDPIPCVHENRNVAVNVNIFCEELKIPLDRLTEERPHRNPEHVHKDQRIQVAWAISPGNPIGWWDARALDDSRNGMVRVRYDRYEEGYEQYAIVPLNKVRLF